MSLSFCFRIFVVFFTVLALASGHGRFVEPPSRASAWRYGFNTPRDYNDNEGFCGGKQHQHVTNGGKCGVCGDAWDVYPRPHEVGGQYATGTLVRSYRPNAQIQASVQITANHKGFFEFRICPTNSSSLEATQSCLDGYPLLTVGSSLHRLYIGNQNGMYNFQLQLPWGLVCQHCVMQWRYVAGNDWGICPDGSGALGCGPQEEFRACADVSILPANLTTPTPHRDAAAPPTLPGPPVAAATRPQLTVDPIFGNALPHRGDAAPPSIPAPPSFSAPPVATRPSVTVDAIFGIPTTQVRERRTCSAYGLWRTVANMDAWCDLNCNHEPPYCPTSHCVCA